MHSAERTVIRVAARWTAAAPSPPAGSQRQGYRQAWRWSRCRWCMRPAKKKKRAGWRWGGERIQTCSGQDDKVLGEQRTPSVPPRDGKQLVPKGHVDWEPPPQLQEKLRGPQEEKSPKKTHRPVASRHPRGAALDRINRGRRRLDLCNTGATFKRYFSASVCLESPLILHSGSGGEGGVQPRHVYFNMCSLQSWLPWVKKKKKRNSQ